MNTNELRILKALETYQWKPNATIYNFAEYLFISESYARNLLGNLVEEGLIERIQDGEAHGKPRYIYRLTEQEEQE